MISSDDGIDLPQKVLFPPERLSLKWTQVHRIGAGLQNMGNTCFLNSALQCLTYTPPFANYMLTREHSKTCKLVFHGASVHQGNLSIIVQSHNNYHINRGHFSSIFELLSCLIYVLLINILSICPAGHEPGFCMMCTMQNHIIQVFANSGNVIKPIGVLNELKSKLSVDLKQ